MKKKFVLFVLFVLPLAAYLFFASGVNSFAKLPILTKSLPEITSWKSDSKTPIQLQNKITILGFTGTDLKKRRGNFFNLYEKIYKKDEQFKDFQVVFIAPVGTEKKIDSLKIDLKKLGSIVGWKFVFATNIQINQFYNQMKLQTKLDQDLGSQMVYIIDKKRNLRGRKGKSVKGEEEYKEGYNTSLVSELHNEMTDDVKVILAEYRLALKINHNASKKLEYREK
jgi:hypothetical protein